MRWSPEEFAEMIGAFRREMAGAIRRHLVTRSGGGVWQVLGHALFDTSKKETREVENYPGIGISARPPDGDSAEGVVIQVGGPNNPALVAMRDEATRAKVNDIAADESTLYNSAARVYVKADGTVEVRTHGGAAVALCTKADADNIRNDVHLHEHLYAWTGTAGSGTTTGGPAVTAPVGTQKLKGE